MNLIYQKTKYNKIYGRKNDSSYYYQLKNTQHMNFYYILQEKVEYAPLIETPDGYAKVEVRLMFLWDKEPILATNLVRTSKGKMMGVDFNKNKTWVGSNLAYHP